MKNHKKTFMQITGNSLEANKNWWTIGFKKETDKIIQLYDKHSDGSIFSPVKRGSYGDGLIEVANYGKSFGFSFRDDGTKNKIKHQFSESMNDYYRSHMNDSGILSSGAQDFGVNTFSGHSGDYTLIMWIANFKPRSLAKLYIEFLKKAIDHGDLAPTFINEIKGKINYA